MCIMHIASTQLFSHWATGTRLKGSGWAPPDNWIPSNCHYASQINLVEGNAEAFFKQILIVFKNVKLFQTQLKSKPEKFI